MLRIPIMLAAPPILLEVSDVNVLHRWPDVFMDLQYKLTPVERALMDRGAIVGPSHPVRYQRGFRVMFLR